MWRIPLFPGDDGQKRTFFCNKGGEEKRRKKEKQLSSTHERKKKGSLIISHISCDVRGGEFMMEGGREKFPLFLAFFGARAILVSSCRSYARDTAWML